MRKIITILCIIIGIYQTVHAQNSNVQWLSGSCQVNANDPAYLNSSRIDAINSTVKLLLTKTNGMITRNCTGTLINRNTSDGDLGYYILTANHNIAQGEIVSGISIPGLVVDVDFNADQYVIFNYQSPNAYNNSTPNSNVGATTYGGVPVQSTPETVNGYEYLHATKLRLVDRFYWGDFALLEILTPVPPHFNVSYAGWNPNSFISFVSWGLPTYVIGIHHPKGDIKKVAGVNSLFYLDNPISAGCYTITTIIDFLFGWLWGHSISTKVVCNYVDIPNLVVPYYQYGVVEEGSSGSGIFDENNRVFGMLSFGLSSCAIPIIETYGKFKANYFNASIKNALNPANDFWVDQDGMASRKIIVYDNLVLPGGDGTKPGYYFPANHYQSDNKIVLKARNNIETTQPIIVFTGADYEFVAGNSITLGPGFTVEAGANFKAEIQSSASMNAKSVSSEQIMIDRLKSIKLPETPKHYDRYIDNSIKIPVKIYPNPANGILNVDLGNNRQEIKQLELCSIIGEVLLKKEIKESIESLNIQSIQSGIYLLKTISINNATECFRIVVNN